MNAPAGPSLRRRLREGERVVGAIVRMPAEDNVEMLAVAGLDFVVIDCEHGPSDLLSLRHHIALAQLHGMAVLVRTGFRESSLVLRALDQGAQGVVAPHIDSVGDARDLVRSAHYPPLGERGFATYPRAGRFGTVSADAHLGRAAEETLVVAMLESPAAVSVAADILATKGIDGYLVGTADLAASSGPDDLPVHEALAAVRDAGRKAGVVRADLAGDTESARKSLDDGAQMIVYNLAEVLMRVFAGLRVSG